MADLGRAALFVSLGLALYATLVGAWAARTRKRRLADSAGNALLAALGSTAVASAVHPPPPPRPSLGRWGRPARFALGGAARRGGRPAGRGLAPPRRWTLIAWTALGIGQLLGAHWAYVEVGWGGYYAWDPVENAALMPWLAATAFLHSVMIQEKRGMLKVWNMLLVVLAFCLAIFGDFLTRSGVINSIHSFAQGKVGPWLLGFICAVTAGAPAPPLPPPPPPPARAPARLPRSPA